MVPISHVIGRSVLGAHGEARNPQHGGLLLDAAAVGENHARARDQAEERQIAHRFHGAEKRVEFEILQM